VLKVVLIAVALLLNVVGIVIAEVLVVLVVWVELVVLAC
jgi:hypothetical protein